MKSRLAIKRFAWGIVTVLVIVVAILGAVIYKKLYTANIIGVNESDQFLYIRTNSTFEDVVQTLKSGNLLMNEKSFRWTAHQLNYETSEQKVFNWNHRGRGRGPAERGRLGILRVLPRHRCDALRPLPHHEFSGRRNGQRVARVGALRFAWWDDATRSRTWEGAVPPAPQLSRRE